MAKTLIDQHNLEYETVRSAAALTTSYVAGTVVKIEGANQVQLLVTFTLGSSDGARIKIEVSVDGTNYFQESGGSFDYTNADILTKNIVRKLSASGSYIISVPVSGSWLKVSALAITSGTGTSMTIVASKANI